MRLCLKNARQLWVLCAFDGSYFPFICLPILILLLLSFISIFILIISSEKAKKKKNYSKEWQDRQWIHNFWNALKEMKIFFIIHLLLLVISMKLNWQPSLKMLLHQVIWYFVKKCFSFCQKFLVFFQNKQNDALFVNKFTLLAFFISSDFWWIEGGLMVDYFEQKLLIAINLLSCFKLIYHFIVCKVNQVFFCNQQKTLSR